ncbi:MAG TPA: hypothetical protein VGM63_21465 [Mucilaginibacter sp.]
MITQNQEREIQSLELQLHNKTTEYIQSLKNGAVFEELKKIHLDKKVLERKLFLSKLHTAVNEPITYFVEASIG